MIESSKYQETLYFFSKNLPTFFCLRFIFGRFDQLELGLVLLLLFLLRRCCFLGLSSGILVPLLVLVLLVLGSEHERLGPLGLGRTPEIHRHNKSH